MRMKKLLSLLLAMALCMSLAACAKGSTEDEPMVKTAPVEENPEFVYVAEYKSLLKDTENFLTVRGYSEDGFYVSSLEKTGENLPAGLMPRYEGEYDVFTNYLYFVDANGKMEKIEAYATLPPKTNEEGRREFSSYSNISGIFNNSFKSFCPCSMSGRTRKAAFFCPATIPVHNDTYMLR